MSKKHQKKQPKFLLSPEPTKQPRLGTSIESINDQYPSWHFDKLDLEFEYCEDWVKIDREGLMQEILPKLKEFERKPWKEMGDRNNHFVFKKDLISDAIRRLEKLKIDDIEGLYSLRLSSTKRIYGIRFNSIIKLLWWDPDHKICPAPLKHT
jgi:hypothetical protein